MHGENEGKLWKLIVQPVHIRLEGSLLSELQNSSARRVPNFSWIGSLAEICPALPNVGNKKTVLITIGGLLGLRPASPITAFLVSAKVCILRKSFGSKFFYCYSFLCTSSSSLVAHPMRARYVTSTKLVLCKTKQTVSMPSKLCARILPRKQAGTWVFFRILGRKISRNRGLRGQLSII